MRKNIVWKGIVVGIVVLLIGMSVVPLSQSLRVKEQDIIDYKNNPWTPGDEGDHFPCKTEWWTFHVALELENGACWDASATFQYETEQTESGTEVIACLLLHYYFDRETGECYDFSTWTKEEKPLSFKKNIVDVQYNNCTLKGLYPKYLIHLEDDEKNFILNIELNASSIPHWAMQEGGDGFIPWGLGWARYGYITNLDITGNFSMNGTRFNTTGVGYYEHAWGNFSYCLKKPMNYLMEFIKKFPKFVQLARWYLSEYSWSFLESKSRTFSTNNLFGYDWAWAAFDNGWSLHFGNFYLLANCVYDGQGTGVLSVTPDGEIFWDFAFVDINYEKMIYIDEADVYLPLDFDLTASKDEKLIHLKFHSITESFMGWNIGPMSWFYCGGGGIVTAGEVDGYYTDGETNISLHGVSVVGPFRQFMYTKYNSLTIKRILPPDGLGFSIRIVSHSMRYELFFKAQIRPFIDFCFYFKRLDDSNFVSDISTHNIDGHEVVEFNRNMEKTSIINGTHTLYVGGTGPDNYSKIQEAIDNASDDDTVYV